MGINLLVRQRKFTYSDNQWWQSFAAFLQKRLAVPFGRRRIKRMMDIYLAGLMVVLLTPLFFAVAIFIKVTSRGPVFFHQKRVGFQGKIFTMFKFRTMKTYTPKSDHEKLIKYIHENQNGNSVQVYKKQIETHITKVGHVLRKTSLDELPQLFNVLRGELSLVGPRPHPVYEVENYKDWYHERFLVMPGMTGLSKVYLRCTPEDYDKSMRLDLDYVKNWSIGLDVKILLKTIPLVFHITNAY